MAGPGDCRRLRHTIPICRKELRRYFASPIGSVLVAGPAVFFALILWAAGGEQIGRGLLGQLSAMTNFRPSREWMTHPVMPAVALGRLFAMVLTPLISMRLFPEEQQTRTMELLLTAPVREMEIVMGKWIGAVAMYLLILAVSMLEIAISPLRGNWQTALMAYGALLMTGAGLLAAGEAVSTLTRHQTAAAAVSLLLAVVTFRALPGGRPDPANVLISTVLSAAGLALTNRSIQKFRSEMRP